MRKKVHKKYRFTDIAWNVWCTFSLIGIWPRFIEPRILATTSLTLKNPELPDALKGLRILQFSDLHFSHKTPKRFLKKLSRHINRLSPDIIVFTGDFINYGILEEPERLRQFLSDLKAPFGCYAVLGNHDYADYVSINEKGDYDVVDGSVSPLKKGLRRLRGVRKPLTKIVTDRARNAPLNENLVQLLKQTPFELLHNSTKVIPIRGSFLNICGLGEYMLGRSDPTTAFKEYDPQYPGIIITHNPDSIPNLNGFPGDIVLCGHSHGGQVNLLGMGRRLAIQENMDLISGLKRVDGRCVYINRGVGSVMPFRWFAPPEILVVTLEGMENTQEDEEDEMPEGGE